MKYGSFKYGQSKYTFNYICEIISSITINSLPIEIVLQEPTKQQFYLAEDIDLVLQPTTQVDAKLELLNSNFTTIAELSGELISDSFTKDANSDVRLTYNCVLHVTDDSLSIAEDSKIWLNKFIRVSIGLHRIRERDVKWYPLGILLFNTANYKYDAVTSTLTLDCADLMCNLTGMRNGYISNAQTTTIAAGSNIRSAMISALVDLGGFKKYVIADIGSEYGEVSNPTSGHVYAETPYDLNFTYSDTVFSIIKALRDIYPAYETYFDVDGTFVCQRIPTCEKDPIVLDAETMALLVKSDGGESLAVDFNQVKNVTEIWGRCLDADRYVTDCTNDGDTYVITIDDLTSGLTNGLTISFQTNVANGNALKVNSYNARPIVDKDGNQITLDETDEDYVVKYQDNKFYLQGHLQVHAIYKDENPDSPFNITKLDEIVQINPTNNGVSSNYEKIDTDEIALENAKYETWKSTRLLDNIAVEMVSVPWLQVNQKVEYTSLVTGETHQYIIKSISGSTTSRTMTVTMIRFYPLYTDIV